MNDKFKIEFDSFNKTKKLYSELQQVGSRAHVVSLSLLESYNIVPVNYEAISLIILQFVLVYKNKY